MLTIGANNITSQTDTEHDCSLQSVSPSWPPRLQNVMEQNRMKLPGQGQGWGGGDAVYSDDSGTLNTWRPFGTVVHTVLYWAKVMKSK